MFRAVLASAVCFAAIASGALPPYVITTVAGSSNVGDGSPATNAYFGILEGAACGPDGSLYLADADDHRIRRITPDGIIHTFAGTGIAAFAGDEGPAIKASLHSPYGLAFDATGQLYIADLGNNSIRKISTDGVIHTAAGGAAQPLQTPRNVTIGPDGLLYFSEFSAHRVSRLNNDGTLTVVAGTGIAGGSGDGGSAVTATLRYPTSIAFDNAGNLYIADSGNARVREVSAERMSTIAGNGAIGPSGKLLLHTPTGLAVDPSGNVYISNDGDPGLVKITPEHTWVSFPGAARDLCFDAAGNLFLAGSQHVQMLAPSGAFQTLYGSSSHDFGNGGPAIAARFGSPAGIALSTDGTYVVADAVANRLREVDPRGIISSSPAAVSSPHGLARDPAGNLLVADTGFHVLQSISPSGAFKTIAGTGNAGTTGDGGLALAARLDAPTVVTTDKAGNTYSVDGNRVRRIVASGQIESFAGTEQPGYNGDGPRAIAVQLSHPGGLAADLSGNIFIADTGNQLLRKVKPDGSLVTVGGQPGVNTSSGDGGDVSAATFSQPMGLAFDDSGNLWIAEAGSSRIRVVNTTGIVQTIAGGGAGFSGDGNYSTGAHLSSPSALAIAADGRVYIADTSNRRIRMLTPNGTPAPVISPDPTPAPGPVVDYNTGPLTVVNAATSVASAPAPGSLVSLFGANLAASPATPGAGVAFTLGGVQLFLNKIAVPLLYVSPTQINAQIPFELAAVSHATLEFWRDGAARSSTRIALSPFDPGLFVGPDRHVAAINADGSINGLAHSAPRGSIVSLYATGDGAETNTPVTGKPATTPLPLSKNPVNVTIGDHLAEVLYAGAAPGLVGVMQVNVRVPAAVAGALAVTVTVGGVSSPPGPVLQVSP